MCRVWYHRVFHREWPVSLAGQRSGSRLSKMEGPHGLAFTGGVHSIGTLHDAINRMWYYSIPHTTEAGPTVPVVHRDSCHE